MPVGTVEITPSLPRTIVTNVSPAETKPVEAIVDPSRRLSTEDADVLLLL